MFLRLHSLYSPDDTPGVAPDRSTYDLLKDEAPEESAETIELEEDKETGKEAAKDEDEAEAKSLEDELEEDLEEPDEKELDEDIIVPVRRKEILAKYPNLFKDFPHLDKAVYREQKFSEIVPTIEDAKEAVRKSEILDNFGKDLSEGKTGTMLKAVKEESPESFNNLVDNYLGQLRDVDEGAYFHVLSNVIKHTIIAMVNSDEQDFKDAAILLNKFVFNTEKFNPPARLGKAGEKDERESQIEEREANFRKEQLDAHVKTVNTRVGNSITATIDKNIDPKDSMNSYVRKQAIRDCSEELEEQIDKDPRFKGILDKLWERAAENDFDQESLDKIRTAYLSKAKVLLPMIIKKTRNEALRGLGKKVLNEDEDRRGPLPVGQTRQKNPDQVRRTVTGNSDKDKARALPKSTKTLDYLMRD